MADGAFVKRSCGFLLGLLLAAAPGLSSADEIRVATASNFRETMTVLAHSFEAQTGHRVTPIFGSTGKHFAQIINGAPFDAFFAADSKRPMRLEKEGRVVAGSRFTYARGKLVLWSPTAAYVDREGEILRSGNFRHLAMANPGLAPYGAAAREVLKALGLWQELEGRVVLGENVGQAFLFTSSGNAELGFVAESQMVRRELSGEGSFWPVPDTLYHPIEQQAVLLQDNEASRAFMSFIRSIDAARIIRTHGYEIAE